MVGEGVFKPVQHIAIWILIAVGSVACRLKLCQVGLGVGKAANVMAHLLIGQPRGSLTLLRLFRDDGYAELAESLHRFVGVATQGAGLFQELLADGDGVGDVVDLEPLRFIVVSPFTR